MLDVNNFDQLRIGSGDAHSQDARVDLVALMLRSLAMDGAPAGANADGLPLLLGAGLFEAAKAQLRRTLLTRDLWFNDLAELDASTPREHCRCCCEKEFPHLAGEGRPHISLCGRNSVQIHERERPINFAEMQTRLEPHGVVRFNELVLKFWHEPYEITLFLDGRAIIKGTTDVGVARSLYARFIGC